MRDSVKWDVAMVEEGGKTGGPEGGIEISVGGGAIMGEWMRGCIWRWKEWGGADGGGGGENTKKTALMWKIWGLDRR